MASTYKIKYKVEPEDATYQDMKFESTDVSIAKVDSNGIISAISSGSCIIKIKSEKYNIERELSVNVSDNPPLSIYVNTNSNKRVNIYAKPR